MEKEQIIILSEIQSIVSVDIIASRIDERMRKLAWMKSHCDSISKDVRVLRLIVDNMITKNRIIEFFENGYKLGVFKFYKETMTIYKD